jgi:Cu(I)/Ag(I) efflux system membrane fusion protein
LQHEKNSSAIGFDYKQLAEATRQKLLLWGMSNMQISDLENSGEVKNIITIASGEDGIISELMISEGDYVMEGTPVFKLTDLSSVYVEAELYSTEAASLTSDTEAEVTVSSLHDKKVRGKITFATPELLADSKIIILRMEIPNPDQSMKPGMQTYITIRSGSKETFAVPLDAVIHDPQGATVWLKKSPGTYEPRMVETGMESKDYIEIISGLEEGDAVVTSGAYLLQSEYIFKKGEDPMAGMEM